MLEKLKIKKEKNVDLLGMTTGVAEGSESSFNEFYLQYSFRLYSYILTLARGNESMARDCLQLSLLKIIKYIHPFDSEPAFWGWCARVSKSVFIDELRKHQRYAGKIEKIHFIDAVGDGQSELLQHLEEVINELSDDDQALVNGIYQEGYTQKELAGRTGITAKAIETRLARVRVKMKAMLLRKLNANK